MSVGSIGVIRLVNGLFAFAFVSSRKTISGLAIIGRTGKYNSC